MKSMIKWLGGIALVCAIGFAALVIVLPMILDPNDYKDKIASLVHEKTGFQLEIPGDIKLSVSPRLEVLFSLGQIRVFPATGSSDEPLFSSEKVGVELSLLPLIKDKRLAIQGLQLHGVYCNLVRDASGRGNWELAKSSAAPAVSDKLKPSKGPQKDTAKTKKSASFELGALDLSKVTVRFEDQQKNKVFELKDLSIHTGHVQDGQLFHLQSKFYLASSGSNNNALNIANVLETDILFRLSEKTLQITNLSLDSAIKPFDLPDAVVKITTNTVVDLSAEKLQIKDLTLSGGGGALTIQVEVENFADPVFKGTVSIPEFSPGKFLTNYNIPQPAWKDEAALQQFGFSCEFAGTMKKIDISTIAIMLDGSHGKGSFVLLDTANPAYDFKMHFDHIDLDRYATVVQQTKDGTVHGKSSAQQAAVKASQKQTPHKDAALQPLFPVDLLRKLQFQLALDVDSMKMKGAQVSKVQLKASAGDGQLAVKPFRAELYDGSVSAEVSIDVRGDVPLLRIKKDLDHVQIGPLFVDMTGKEEVTGAAVLSLQVSTQGNSKERLIAEANGTMSIGLENGVIKKLHILQIVRQAKALYDKEPLIQTSKDEPTGFARISATGRIKNGVFHNNDLKLSSDLMTVTGAGKVDFTKEYVDYLLKVSLASGMDRNDTSGKTDYSKFVIPYRIHGEFSTLKEEADVVGLFKEQAKTLLMDELQKQLNKSGGDAKQGGKSGSTEDLLQQGLKSLFGN